MKAVSLGTDDIDEAERIACAKFMPIVLTTSEEIVAAYGKNARQLGGRVKSVTLGGAWEKYSASPDPCHVYYVFRGRRLAGRRNASPSGICGH